MRSTEREVIVCSLKSAAALQQAAAAVSTTVHSVLPWPELQIPKSASGPGCVKTRKFEARRE